jgi:hypothetical protein
VAYGLFRLNARRDSDAPPERPLVLSRPVDPDIDHIRGPVDAPLTLIEYGDYQCPFCGTATDVVEDLRERFGDGCATSGASAARGQHPDAAQGRRGLGGRQRAGPLLEFHDGLFARGAEDVGLNAVIDEAQRLGLDLDRFVDDLQEGAHTEHVRQDVESAGASGVQGTPTFFVGDRRHEGPWDAETLAAASRRPASAPSRGFRPLGEHPQGNLAPRASVPR